MKNSDRQRHCGTTATENLLRIETEAHMGKGYGVGDRIKK